jgi:hypothetical protein
MKLLLWNIEWSEKHSKRGWIIQRIISDSGAEVVCLTETTIGMIPEGGRALLSDGDFGYPHDGNRRKVALWSNHEWTAPDCCGHSGLPGGRFVSGVTHGIRFIGVCIPWKDAHVRTGNRNQEPWGDHLTYIARMGDVLQKYCAGPEPVCLLGDYNQRIPRVNQPVCVYEALARLLSDRLICATAGIKSDAGLPFIDHIAATPGLKIKVDSIIPKEAGGVKLSDHDGIICTI